MLLVVGISEIPYLCGFNINNEKLFMLNPHKYGISEIPTTNNIS